MSTAMPRTIQTLVAELLSEYQIPSAAIGVLQDGQITDFAVGVRRAIPAGRRTG
jgi:hypothetical protein